METGTADLRLAAAVAGYDGTAPSHAALLAALVDAQVLVAITATSAAEHAEEGTGLRAESSAELAVVLVAGADGRRALPVFTSAAAMTRWRLDVRPVRLSGPQAARAALDDGAVALLVEGTVSVTELDDVAAGWVPVLGSGLATRVGTVQLRDATATSDDLVAALRAALAGERLRSARLLDGPDGLVLGVAPKVALGPAGLAALAQRVVGRLGDALPTDGLDLAQVARRGPGRELLRRTRWFS